MKRLHPSTIFILFFMLVSVCSWSQQTPSLPKNVNKYDSAQATHSPRKAAIRSAILPGLGQIKAAQPIGRAWDRDSTQH